MTEDEKRNLDRQIEVLQDEVWRVHDEYEALKNQLMELIERRHPEKKEERIKEQIYEAYRKSEWSLEEVLSFLDGTFEDRYGF